MPSMVLPCFFGVATIAFNGFDGSRPLVKRCDGFDGSLWSRLLCSNKTHSLTRVNLWSESYKLVVSLSCSILWSFRFILHQADFSAVFFHILIGICHVKRLTNPITKSQLSEAANKYVSLTWVFAARSLPARSIM